MTEPTEYTAYLAGRCDEWRAKHPGRSAELRILVRKWMGIQPTHSGKLADAASLGVENEVIRLMSGWPREEDWQPTPLSGRERALNENDR